MAEDFTINLIYGTDGNKWTHHMDDANAGGAKVLKWDLRCFDERTPFTRYQAWIDVTFKDPSGKETKSIQIGPQDPFNLASAGNSTRWSFVGSYMPSPLAGTMELSLRKATVNGKQTLGDPVLFSDTKRLGHQVGPTATATGTPTTKKVPARPYTVYVVNKFPAQGAHSLWSESEAEKDITPKLKEWMARVVMYKNNLKTPASTSDPLYQLADCVWGTSLPGTIQPNEMFVRICRFADSKFTQAQKNTATQAGAHGATAMIGKNVHCEVWPDKLQTNMTTGKMVYTIAQLIFHEWMHFKSDVDKEDAIVHLRDYGFGQLPIGDETPTNPNDMDLKLVADGLDSTFTFHPQ